MLREAIETLLRRQDLTPEQAEAIMAEVMEGRATPAQIAGFLVALAMKGERPAEIVGLARTMRAHSVTLSRPRTACFDTCGTGGDRSYTFNVSSLAALVLAGCGVEVAKHGNRSVSSRCGSADLFEALGVNVGAAPASRSAWTRRASRSSSRRRSIPRCATPHRSGASSACGRRSTCWAR